MAALTSNGARARPPRPSLWLSRHSPLIDVGQAILLFGALIWLIFQGAQEMGYNWQWYRVPRYLYRVIDGEFIPGPLLRGLSVTLQLTAYSTVLTLAIGLLVALLRMSESFSGRLLSTIYLEVVRNTPVLVQIFIFYFVVAPIVGIDAFWVGVLALSFHEGMFAAEIIRGGIQAVPRGQFEAGAAIGLTRYYRFRDIVAPQAIPLILPPMTGEIINLIKHSAILSVIAIAELTTQGLNVIAQTFMAFEIWFTVAAIYLVITVSLSLFVSWLEHRFARGR